MSALGRYDPNQPRVPAGNPDGGQWTSDESAAGTSAGSLRKVVQDTTAKQPWKAVVNDFRPDGTLSRQTVVNRDGSAIRSDFAASDAVTGWDERHTVFMPDGSRTVFENSGLAQTILDGDGNVVSNSVWTVDGPEPAATVLPAFFETPTVPYPALRALGAAAALYTWMSSRNSADQTAVLAFRADAYRPGRERRGQCNLGRAVDARSGRRRLPSPRGSAKHHQQRCRGHRPWPIPDADTIRHSRPQVDRGIDQWSNHHSRQPSPRPEFSRRSFPEQVR
jgi:hypothetical protein